MTVKITDKKHGFEMRFAPWDGYSKRDVAVIKQIPGARYNPVHQVWTAPGSSRSQVELLKISIRAQIYLEQEMAPEVYGVVPPLPEPTIIPPVKNITMRHYQLQGSERMIELESCINGDDPGLGKAQPLTSRVLTPSGWRLMGSLGIGDLIIGSDGKRHQVTGVFPQGLRKIYKVTFNDGFSCECDLEHLWRVRDQNRRRRGDGWAVKPLSELIKWGLEHSPNENRFKSGRKPALKWEIPICAPVFKYEKNYVIHPYIMGALLGDGYICGKTVSISIPDFQRPVYDTILELLPEGLKMRENRHPACPQYAITQNTTTKKNPFKIEIARLGVNVKGPVKFIPSYYMEGSAAQRTQLLIGLMDTDGSCKKNRTTFHTVSKRLAYDIAELAQSLGGIAIIREYDRSHQNKRIEYQVNIRTNFAPFTLPEKLKHWSENKRIFASRYIKTAEYIGELPAQCISVSAQDNLYITDNYIVTHNTIQAICTLAALKKFPAVVVCPATLKLNWYNEITQHSDLRCMILSDQNKQSWIRYYEAGRVDIFIVNYESLKKYFVLSMPDKKDLKISKLITLRPEWDKVQCVVIDESHRLKDPTTIQTKLCLRLCHNKKHVYLLTGTPVVNKPIDLYPQLAIMSHLKKFGDKKGFIDRYCDGGTGANNLKELNFLLNKYCYFKRNKRDVLTEIPPKQRQTIICEISTRKEYDLAENEFKRWLRNEGCTDREIAKKMRAEILVKMNALRNISARGKIPAVREYTNDLIASGEKVVLFANLKIIFAMLGEYYKDALYIHGDIPFDQRQRNINAFQTDPNKKLIICGIKPAGVGVTLTASSNIGIIEYPWHWADCLQIEDRLDRIGQQNSVMAAYFFGQDTIDQRLFEIIQGKKEVGNAISGSVDNIEMQTIDKILNLFI